MAESSVFQAMGRDPTSSREAIPSGSRNNDLHADFTTYRIRLFSFHEIIKMSHSLQTLFFMPLFISDFFGLKTKPNPDRGFFRQCASVSDVHTHAFTTKFSFQRT